MSSTPPPESNTTPTPKAAPSAAGVTTQPKQALAVGVRWVRGFFQGVQTRLKAKKAPLAAPEAATEKPSPPPASVRARAFVKSHWNWKKALIGSVGGVVLLGVLAWQFLPDYLKEVAEEEATAILGRKVTIGAVEWDPLSMELDITGINIAGATTKKGIPQPLLTIKKLYVNLEWESLLRLEPVVENITIESPALRVTHQGKGAYDFDDILKNIHKWQSAHPPTPNASPTPLALYNIAIHNGVAEFIDQLPTGQTQHHHISQLELGIPFFSNIATHRAVTVQPRLAFDLNGSHFETVATTTPTLSETAKTSAHFKISGLDVAQYAPYFPASLPIRPYSALVDADIEFKFDAVEPGILDETKIPSFTLSGTVNASNIALIDNRHQPALTAGNIALHVTEARPMEQILKLESLLLQTPTVYATRNKDGRLNWDFAPKKGAAHADAASATAEKNQKSWNVELAHLKMQQGSVHWTDAAPAAQLSITQWNIKADAITWPLTATPLHLHSSLQIPTPHGNAGLLTINNGRISQHNATAAVRLRDVNLALGQPYLHDVLEPELYGLVDADMEVKWSGSGLPTLSIDRGAVRQFALKFPHALPKDAKSADIAAHDLPSWEILDITKGFVNPNDHSASAIKVILRSPSVMLHRNAKKQWVALQWLKHKKPSPPPATESDSGFSMDTAVTAVTAVTQSVSRSVNAVSSMITSNTGTGTGTGSDTPTAPPVVVHPSEPWKLSFTELNIEQGEVRLDDRAPSPRGVRLTLSDLSLKTHNFNPTGTEPIPLRLSARVRSSRDLDKLEPGYLYYSGSIQWNPVLLRQGVLDLQAVPLHVLAPYLANYINFSVERADTNYKGTLELAISPEGELQLKTLGDAALNNWNLQTISNKGVYEDLLHWGSLQLPGIDLQITPHKATQFRLRNATLSDFYARIEIDSNGRLNLQKLYKAPPPPPEDAPESIPADIALGAIQIINGAVAFSDFHITPNYSANLSQLQGKISQFSSTPTMGDIQLADVTISGKAEGSALLELTGKINPLAKPLVMNIRGKVRDLDLPALNAYSEKHMGYVIDNGKLNLDVEYEIQPNGDLVANNQLVLKQLALTEKEDDSITKLPLKLAISLLSDRNGVVHMDLPISGSLKDPDFQITTVLWEIFRNLILKTLTAPFSLLAKVFGGDDNNTDWNSIYFAPGSSALNSTAMQVLNQQVELLAIRPKLNVSITGEAYLAADKEALRREQLRNVVLSEKRRRAVRDESLNTGLITQEEYNDLLRIIYRRSDIPKPRNWIGLEKDMPIKEVEEAMLGSIVITEESIRELALQRGNAVKDYLLRHKLDAKRIYLQAPRTQNPETDWKPRVQLGIKENQE